MALLKDAAISGNVLFILWTLFNSMDEEFNGRLLGKLSAIGLVGLLTINSFLLIKQAQKQKISI